MVKEKPEIKNITQFRSFLLGLLGHVDSGKTAIARQLSEIISTSGLDAHPQSKDRGITIDLGFTSFIQENYLITLVDAPGHADLIRSVVASARIIDGAIVVLDGKEGIQIQTAEHMVILEMLDITKVIFVINKIDAISHDAADEIEHQLRELLINTKFSPDNPIIRVSARLGTGIDNLKEEIMTLVKNNPIKQPQSEFLVFPIDHHFHKKGVGVIVTGTTHSSLHAGEKLTIIPHLKEVKVKNAQVYHQNVQKVPHGFRAGVVISDVEVDQLQRGDILTNNPDMFKKIEIAEINYELSPHFQKTIKFGSQINVTHGLITTNARFFPFYYADPETRMYSNEVSPNILINWRKKHVSYGAYLWFLQPQYVLLDEILILSQLDLPPSTLRFFGSAKIEAKVPIKPNPEVFTEKIKHGKIKNPNYSDTTILIENLAQSKEGAQTLLNKKLEAPYGRILGLFGGKGVVIAEKPRDLACEKEDKVQLRILRSIQINKNASYN
ncbi:MAG: GTP-binding protein [Candidatus Lokiarchaeota archaeon]|nr:GTP-binding protein [Candidatus Lokiarchaeota archaeon]